ncbi:retrotransposon protein, putative, ty1-copia subclass [Tanacetum coccineum]
MNAPILRLLELRSMFKKQAGVEKFDLIQSFHSCKQEEGKPDADYSPGNERIYGETGTSWLCTTHKNHSWRKFFNGLTKDFAWILNCPVYLAELLKKKKQVGSASSSESATRILNMVPTKKVDKTPYELWLSSLDIPMKRWVTKISTFPTRKAKIVVFARSRKETSTPNPLMLNVEVEEHSLGDLGEPANYKAAMLDPESKRWVDAMNAEMQSMIDNIGLVDPKHPRKVCKLQRSIYRLKQASRSWNKRFDKEIKKFGFDQNLDEPCVYQKASGSNVTFLILYVDDIIIMGNHIPSLQSVKNCLGKCFSMKDLGEAAFILGIKIYRDRSKRLIRLSQNAYMDKILKRYKMDNSKRGTIPMQEDLDLTHHKCLQTLKSRFSIESSELTGTLLKNNFWKYLRNTKDMFLVYGGNPSTELRVECYCDAGFETDRDDTKSQTGYYSATWLQKLIWIRKFISGLGIVPTINEPSNMYCDNSTVIHYANEPGVQRGARHYHRRYHYVRECVELGEIRILKVHTDNNLADPFTKALSNRKLTQHARSMGLRPASSFM